MHPGLTRFLTIACEQALLFGRVKRVSREHASERSLRLLKQESLLAGYLTMVEVAEVEDGVVIIDRVAIFYDEGEGGEHYRNKNKFRCRVSRIENRLVKLKEKICLLPARRVRRSR